MRLALAQLSSGEDRGKNLEKALAAMEAAGRAGAQMIAFPEVVLDRFFPQCRGNERAASLAEPIPGPSTERIAAKAAELGMVTVFNLYEVDGAGRYFDSSPVFDADGTLLGITRMLHITDFEGFHEQDYYHPGDRGMPVYQTKVGKIGIAICYDRHYPEVMRTLGLKGADLVVIPQAGVVGEWPEGLYEAEVRTAAFQNGYFVALCNRVGQEDSLNFAGESFVSDPDGRILVTGKSEAEDLVVVNLDLDQCAASCGRRLFLRDRRPELYGPWFEGSKGC